PVRIAVSELVLVSVPLIAPTSVIDEFAPLRPFQVNVLPMIVIDTIRPPSAPKRHAPPLRPDTQPDTPFPFAEDGRAADRVAPSWLKSWSSMMKTFGSFSAGLLPKPV